MGLVNLLVLVPLIPILVSLSAIPSPASLGLTPSTVGFLVFIGIVNNVLSDYLWARAVIYTSATVATIGLTLTVPLGILTDFLDGSGITGMRVAGAAGIVLGFMLVNI
jgi:solute carrier family 35 protein F5